MSSLGRGHGATSQGERVVLHSKQANLLENHIITVSANEVSIIRDRNNS